MYSIPKIVTDNISKMKKAVPYLLPRELTDSIDTAKRLSRIIADRNLSQMRLTRSFPLDRVRIRSMRFLVTIGRSIPNNPLTVLIIGMTGTD